MMASTAKNTDTAATQQADDSALHFTTTDARIAELLELTHEISDLSALNALAEWDQNTALPDGAAEVRGAQLAAIQGAIHERWIAPRLGTLVNELADVVNGAQAQHFTDADRGLVRQTKRSYDHSTKLPKALVQEMARVGSASFDHWRKARTQSDFALFAPWLERTIALQREVADRYGYTEARYDALLDLYEPEMTGQRVDSLFAAVRETSVTLLRRIEQSGHTIDAACLEGAFPGAQQVALCHTILERMGYDFTRGGLAESPHPFTIDFGSPYDVRVTVHPDERFMQAALMAAIHEGGHAVYEQGSAPSLTRTPVVGGASMGAHESQSRLWENAIGRSPAFWQGQFDAVRTAFPAHFGQVDVATFARALNHVEPSLIRVEADEVTYNLHIIIRFELEKAMVNGEVKVESLPGMWNAKYQEYLGITPPNDAEGILQDIHWSSGFGYFPTYTLGNLYAAQIYAALRKAHPDFDERLATGDTVFILNWLRERMYSVGSIYLPETLIERVTGEAPNPAWFARYLNQKFEQVYDLPKA
ncbi:MAG: carboxypeptidase M32 [Ktedonobacterales bacterium]